MIRILLFLLALVLQAANVKNVTPAEFAAAMKQKNAVVIDLRTAPEIRKKGRIPGARTVDYLSDSAEAVLLKIDHSRPVLVYCAGGGRSSDCATMMSAAGFRHILNLEKGFDQWKSQGFPVEEAGK
jgi:rhodanese-related sulfurtransferase